MRRALAAPLLCAACAAAACSPGLVRLPTGASIPVAPEAAAAALAEAARECRAVRTVVAEVGVSGTAASRRVRGRLLVGLEAPASARLEAIAPFGPPLFVYAAVDGSATLLLPREDRYLEGGEPAAVLRAMAGIPLDTRDLYEVLTGCAGPEGTVENARRFGDLWMALGHRGGELYLRRERPDDPWQLVVAMREPAAGRDRWRAEYANRQAGVPRTIRVTSLDEGGPAGGAFDLRLELAQVEINTALDDGVFDVPIPPEALPVTIEELRDSGPLAPPSDAP